MANNSLIRKKTFDFAIDIIKTCDSLPKDEEGYNFFADQIKRSGTLIGALVIHLDYEPTHTAILSKIKEILKEISETVYWIDLLNNTGILEQKKHLQLLNSLHEIKALLEDISASNMFN